MEEHQNNTNAQNPEADFREATPKVMKAGSEAKAAWRGLRGGASDSGNAAEGTGATEAARSVLQAGQQTLEGAEAATHAAVDSGESTGAGQVLEDWASFVKRAMLRNTQTAGDLLHCYTVFSLLQWQSHLLNATITGLWETNPRILRLLTHKA